MVFERFCLAAMAVLLPAAASEARTDPKLQAVLVERDHDEHPDLKGVVILRAGKIVAERYYNGETARSLHDIRSAGKSITSLLLGIAIDRGAIKSVTDPVAAYWPEAKHSAIGSVPLDDVLTMRSGLAAYDEDPASPGNEDKMDAAPDPLSFVLAVPAADPPGSVYRYNSVTAYTAGVVIAKATHQKMASFARSALFAPLGITRWQWASDSAGYTKGQGNLSITARGLAAIGELVRNDGRHHGRQLVSAAWLHRALAPKVNISATDPYADGYGYFWYAKVQPVGDRQIPVSFASGNGGNKIYVVPSRRLVIAITSSAYGHGYGQRRSESILKAVLAADGSAR
ncbi:serine hydrolase domain-containing protein [Sphingomonas oligophenolica]|uniref:Serine hydrolase domain-containing protein n=1 Tax=Sphingomonas oligophenolica TaxID=301154 RepID=A0ABU9Y174_9SPHN